MSKLRFLQSAGVEACDFSVSSARRGALAGMICLLSLCGPWTAEAVGQNQVTSQLLVNPGAEAGTIANWTATGGATVDNGSLGGFTPHTGTYDFVGFSGNTASLSQTVSIVVQGITAADVDSGKLSANMGFWEQGVGQSSPSDDAEVGLTFLDVDGAAISSVNSGEVDNHAGVWGQFTGQYAIPVGTRSITYTMTFFKHIVSSSLNAYVDDNSLTISSSVGLAFNPLQLHFGNQPTGTTSAAQVVTISNPGTATVNIAQIASELGANPTDFVQTNNCPAALAGGASCTMSVTFTPSAVGPEVAGIDFPDDSVPADQFVRVDGTGTGGILQVNPSNLKTIAGDGTLGYTGDGGAATAAELNQPNGIGFDPSGNLYIADDVAEVVRKVDTTGKITTFAGTGTKGYSGDGGAATAAQLYNPSSVASDKNGNIYIQDTGNYVIQKVDTTGTITTFAGTGVPGHSGDGGPATAARFNNNVGARFDSAGNFFVPQCRGASIRHIDTNGIITTVAGNFTQGYSGDGGPATAAQLQCPSGVAIDAVGNFYIADYSNNVIRKVNTQGIISTIAGSTAGTAGVSGDGGPATAALLSLPNDVALDSAGNLYIADSANNRVRKIDTNGIITTVAGGLNNAGSPGVNTPLGVTVDAAGNAYFTDSGNGKVQEVFPQGTAPFPATQVGTTAMQTLTVSNIGNVTVTIPGADSFTTSGNTTDFTLTGGTCFAGATLTASGGSCTLTVSFTPTAVGQRSLTVAVADDALNSPQSFTVGGTGVPYTGVPVITWATPAPITTATPLGPAQLNAVATDPMGGSLAGTYVYTPAAGTLLAAGTQTLSVLFTPTGAPTLPTATKTVQIVVTQATAATTNTTLAVTSGGSAVTTVAAGSVVTLTATVMANSNSVSPGQVAFCDATATACTDIHLLATAQLVGGDSSAIATYTFVPGIGAHSYKAVFLGTVGGTATYAGSATETASLAVTGTYPTATTIAQSGTAGDYTLTSTTVGTSPLLAGPTGSISFEDTSNANAVLGTATLGASTPGFALAQASGSPVAVASGPYGVATGDFNGDGFADVVTENYNAGTVSVLLGKGDGTFQPQVTYAVGNRPERVLVADLNGDGKLDLVVANTGSNTIGVLLGNGDGTFQAQATYPSASPVGLGVMDLNHDGIPDVVAGDYYANTISVLLGKGDGTLQTAVTYPTGSTPQTVAEGDFNGDGNVDVVVGNEGASTVGVFLGNGDGTFQAMVTYGVGRQPEGVQVGDFNGDGKLDIAATSQADGTMSILLGKGDGTFQTQVTYPVGNRPVALEVADFNGDGIADITVGNAGQTDLTQGVLLGKGDGTFQTMVAFKTGNFPYGVAVADFNGDGLPDMAVTNFNDATATIFLSQPTQTATASVSGIAPTGTGTHAVVASYPGDASYSKSVSLATTLSVSATTPVITWVPTIATIPYGTALGAAQLDASAATAAGVAIPGAFVYTPAAGTVLTPGTQTLSVVFTPTDTAAYTVATGSVSITVGGLGLSGIAPVGAVLGSRSTTITLTGTGFVPSSVVLAGTNRLATTYVNPTTLMAVVPATLLGQTGTLAIVVNDPSIEALSAAQTFTVLPPSGAATLTGPATTPPGSQPSVGLTITNPYPLALTAEFTLTFASATNPAVVDPSIQFSTGGQTYSYTVAANTTSVPPVQLQAGTVAGTITIAAKLMADGVDVTPTVLAPLVIVVPAVVPVLSGTTVTRSGDTLTVVIHGFSNTREVSEAEFDFTAATGDTLATPKVTIPATTIFSDWFVGDKTSPTYGSTFTYTQVFHTSGDASTVGAVKVTLTNSVGVSLVGTSP